MPASNSLLRDFASRTLVIIPAHNEAACVGDVVTRLRQFGFEHIRVVDNASTDTSGQVAREAGAEVLFHPQRGYGLACWIGGVKVPQNIDWLLYCNADASDDFEAYREFARIAPENDLILGARTYLEDRQNLTAPQRFGNWLAPFLIRLFWGRRFADLGPQRAIRVSAYERLCLRDRGFGWTVEMQVRAVEEGLRIAEIPARCFPRPAGKSKISGNFRGSLFAGVVILQTIGSLAWRRFCSPKSPGASCASRKSKGMGNILPRDPLC
jgi:glycosyltransferase involved in cell wall biosynthesis